MMRFVMVAGAALILTGCDYVEETREIGYKGKARVDPWLAAERYCKRVHRNVRSLASWSAPAPGGHRILRMS